MHRKKLRRSVLTAVLVGGLSLGVAACDDTVEGIEEDAEELEDEVDDVDVDIEEDGEG